MVDNLKKMRSRCMVPLLFTALLALPTPAAAGEADSIVGTWMVAEKTGKIEIFKCGNRHCGKLVWIKPSAKNPHPEETLDLHNPDPKKRSQKMIGKTILWGLVYDKGDEKWEEGSIYDNRSGKVYSCEVSLKPGGNQLQLRGFLGIALLGKTTIWTRVR